MRRGTTPTQILTVDTDLTTAEVIYITYKQRGVVVMEKQKDEVDVYEDRIEFTMTQEETLAFNNVFPVSVQIRARYPEGEAVASNIVETNVQMILKEGVI